MSRKKDDHTRKDAIQRDLGKRLEEFRPIDAVFGKLIFDKQWADAMGVSRFTLGSMLKGTKEVKVTNLQQVFKALPIPKEWKLWVLMGGDPPEEEPPTLEYNGRRLSIKKIREKK